MDVTQLPKDPGPAAWNCILPPQPETTPLQKDQSADWLIIGAGFAGLSAARRILEYQPHAHIVILEATRLAQGPAGRNSGFMIDLPHDLGSKNYAGALEQDRATIQDNRLAISFAREMAQDYHLTPEAFSLSGKINGAATAHGDRHNQEFGAHLSAMGEPWQVFDKSKMAKITGSHFYQSGLYTPGTAIIQPALYIRSIAQGLQTQGLKIFEKSPVTRLTRTGKNWTAQTLNAQISAPKAILAVNGHLASFGHMPRHLMHVFTYGSMTRALTKAEIQTLSGDPIWSLTPSDPMGTTVRRIAGIGGTRIVIRNRFTFDPSMEISPARLGNVAQNHAKSFAARFPMLKDVGMDYLWGGRLCLARNGVQVVGEIEPGLYAACCQNGLGTVRGTLAGMMAVDEALNIPSNALARMQAQAQPSKLPPKVISQIGANLRLRWGEYKAGNEL